MINRCEEFYTNLYSTKLPQGQPPVQIQRDTLNTPPPPILQTEVSAAIKRLKRNKAPGNDNITADVLKDGGEPIVRCSPIFSTGASAKANSQTAGKMLR